MLFQIAEVCRKIHTVKDPYSLQKMNCPVCRLQENRAVRILLFDMMDTLIEDPYHNIDKLIENHGLQMEEFLSYKNPEAFEKFERGFISEQEYFKSYYVKNLPSCIQKKLPRPEKIKKYIYRNIKFIDGIEETLKWLSAQKSCITAITSNYSEWYKDIFRRRPELESYFDLLFFSCEMGVRKPHSEYFATVENSLKKLYPQIEKSNIMFFDDKPINTNSAKNHGWQIHLMENAKIIKNEIYRFMQD